MLFIYNAFLTLKFNKNRVQLIPEYHASIKTKMVLFNPCFFLPDNTSYYPEISKFELR